MNKFITYLGFLFAIFNIYFWVDYESLKTPFVSRVIKNSYFDHCYLANLSVYILTLFSIFLVYKIYKTWGESSINKQTQQLVTLFMIGALLVLNFYISQLCLI